jgi:hypothetical protein
VPRKGLDNYIEGGTNMPLNWNATRVREHEALHEQDTEWVKTETLVWATMAIGISGITEDNWPEFWARFDYYNRLVRIDHTRSGITASDVERRIGLFTNGDNKTEAQFIKTLGAMLIQDARDQAIREVAAIKRGDDGLVTSDGQLSSH